MDMCLPDGPDSVAGRMSYGIQLRRGSLRAQGFKPCSRAHVGFKVYSPPQVDRICGIWGS